MFLTREWSEPESQVVLLKNQDLRLRGGVHLKRTGVHVEPQRETRGTFKDQTKLTGGNVLY